MARTHGARVRWAVLPVALALIVGLAAVSPPISAAAATNAAADRASAAASVAGQRTGAAASTDPSRMGVAAMRSDGVLAIAATGPDHRVRVLTSRPGSGFSATVDLGGPVLGSPALSITGSQIDVVVIGMDHRLRMRTYDAGRWTGWTILGNGHYQAGPAAVRTPGGALYIVAMGTSGGVYQVVLRGSTVSIPRRLSRSAAGTPAITYRPTLDEFYTFWIGADGRINRLVQRAGRTVASGTVSSGGFFGGVASIRSPDGTHRVVAMRSDRHLYQIIGGPRGWSAPTDLGGPVRGTPAIAYDRTRLQVDVLATGLDNRVKHRAGAGGKWTGWRTVSGGSGPLLPATSPRQLAATLLGRWGGSLSGLPAVLADLRAAAEDRTINNSSSCGRAVRLDPALLRLLLATTTRYRVSINNIVTGHGCDGGWHPRGAAVDFATVTDPRTGAHSNLHTGMSGDNDTLDREFTAFLAVTLPSGGALGQRYCGSRGGAAIPAGILFFSDSCTHQHAQLHY